jgi:hypothetical protein
MALMVLGYLPGLPKFFYIAVYRARGRISRAAWVLVAFAALEIAVAVVGCLNGGLTGLCYALLAVAIAEALVTAPAVIRTATSYGRHRRPTSGSGNGVALGPRTAEQRSGLPSAHVEPIYRDQQLEALRVLLSMASPWTIPIPVVPLDTDHGSGDDKKLDGSATSAPGADRPG